MKIDPCALHLEAVLDRELARSTEQIELLGTDSTLALALFFSQNTSPTFWRTPHLAVFAEPRQAELFEQHLRFFDPELRVSVLRGFDVDPYSSLYPSLSSVAQRVRWLHEAASPSVRHIFICDIVSLTQRSVSPSLLRQCSLRLKIGMELPSNVSKVLIALGYLAAPVVEDVGSFAMRGGILDIYSPAHDRPIRIELFGDQIDSLRFFDPDTQRSDATEPTLEAFVLPPREVIYDDERRQKAAHWLRQDFQARDLAVEDRDVVLQEVIQARYFPGLDFLLPAFSNDWSQPLDHFSKALTLWQIDTMGIARALDDLQANLKTGYQRAQSHAICPKPEDLYLTMDQLRQDGVAQTIVFAKLHVEDSPSKAKKSTSIPLQIQSIENLTGSNKNTIGSVGDTITTALNKVLEWREEGFYIFVGASTQAQAQRLKILFEHGELLPVIVDESAYLWSSWCDQQSKNPKTVHIVPRRLSENLKVSSERFIFLRDEDFFGKKQRRKEHKASGTLTARAHAMAFSDLNPGDNVVHTLHGIGVYDGLKVMGIQGVDSEYIQVTYRDNDKLYLPIYRISQLQKYAGSGSTQVLDKLGGVQWQKTKAKVKNHLREIAAELLQLYAKRRELTRPPLAGDEDEFFKFETQFVYDETDDQLRAIQDIVNDLSSDRPMDRLVCGDVGFGKTEVAMRAAFRAVQAGKQVAVLSPTTVLSFQHLETFKKRFKGFAVNIAAINRFVEAKDAKKMLGELKEGRVDILIGTHRVLSKDVKFKDLGLIIIDEEHKFGVQQKEKIKLLKASVDTLTLSATPIPRTLNMSLSGMRDLSIINTAPVDRLPTRTFVCKFDEETIRNAIESEIKRGGQVFFLHNRVQSIYASADELRRIVPEARIRIGHGQMLEHELESVMVSFFNHEIDVLLCTTIIESGIDNPRANTMFIDDAHTFGLAQLYQLRGRVGRSKERAYCYLLIPQGKRLESDAQERLKVIQENTALGSGIRIAHHDLELRGSGNILGEDQSGHIDSVGYEMYLELLEEAISNAKGEPVAESLEPEINIRIPALIPADYMPDLRIRLSYYKAMTEIEGPEDIDRIEDELRDQFGKLPEQVVNLMGLMMIRKQCKDLGVRDINSGVKTISLAFTERTTVRPENIVKLALRDNKKFTITPDNRLIIRMNEITWPRIYDELLQLKKLSD